MLSFSVKSFPVNSRSPASQHSHPYHCLWIPESTYAHHAYTSFIHIHILHIQIHTQNTYMNIEQTHTCTHKHTEKTESLTINSYATTTKTGRR